MTVGQRTEPPAPAVEPAATPPLLVDSLVIASAERRREPELPASTVAAALAAPLPTAVARYDLV
ncbi:MAG: hypothetical protein M3Q10_10175, partial [Chloroflexota bacterium]|nr:hypothetical protein [Chloroflexota bacterium]